MNRLAKVFIAYTKWLLLRLCAVILWMAAIFMLFCGAAYADEFLFVRYWNSESKILVGWIIPRGPALKLQGLESQDIHFSVNEVYSMRLPFRPKAEEPWSETVISDSEIMEFEGQRYVRVGPANCAYLTSDKSKSLHPFLIRSIILGDSKWRNPAKVRSH